MIDIPEPTGGFLPPTRVGRQSADAILHRTVAPALLGRGLTSAMGQKRTSAVRSPMSAMCHKQTYAPLLCCVGGLDFAVKAAARGPTFRF
jgi:hypothetical protein